MANAPRRFDDHASGTRRIIRRMRALAETRTSPRTPRTVTASTRTGAPTKTRHSVIEQIRSDNATAYVEHHVLAAVGVDYGGGL